MARSHEHSKVTPLVILALFGIFISVAMIGSVITNQQSRTVDRSFAQIAGAHPTRTPTRTPTSSVRCFDGTRPHSCCSNGALCTESGFCVGIGCTPPTRTPTRAATGTRTPTPRSGICLSCSNICIYGSYGGDYDDYCLEQRGTGFKCCRSSGVSPTLIPRCPDGTREYGCCPANKRICRRNYAGTYSCIGGTTDCVPVTPFQLVTATRTPTRTRTPTVNLNNTDCSNATCTTSYKYAFFCDGRNRECKTTFTVKTCRAPYAFCNRVSPLTRCYTTYFGNCADSIECTSDEECNVAGRSGYRCVTSSVDPELNNHCTNR